MFHMPEKERKKERNATRMQEKDLLNVNSLNIIWSIFFFFFFFFFNCEQVS